MKLSAPGKAQVYVNHGRVIANCPFYPHCRNAVQLQGNEAMFHCAGLGGCNAVAALDWPDDLDEIVAVLEERRFKQYMNWFPADHPLAIKSNAPMAQTPDELRKETAENFKQLGIS